MKIKKHFYTKIVGVTKINPDGSSRQKLLKKCKAGERLVLVREHDNPYDQNAIQVRRLSGEMLGYIPKETAEIMIEESGGDLGNKYLVEIKDLTGGGLIAKRNRGCNLIVYVAEGSKRTG